MKAWLVKRWPFLAAGVLLVVGLNIYSDAYDSGIERRGRVKCVENLVQIARAKANYVERHDVSDTTTLSWSEITGNDDRPLPKTHWGRGDCTYIVGALNAPPMCSQSGHNRVYEDFHAGNDSWAD